MWKRLARDGLHAWCRTSAHFGLLLSQKVRKGNLKLQVEVLDVVERFAQQNGLPAFDDIGVTFLDVSLWSLFHFGIVSLQAFLRHATDLIEDAETCAMIGFVPTIFDREMARRIEKESRVRRKVTEVSEATGTAVASDGVINASDVAYRCLESHVGTGVGWGGDKRHWYEV